MRLYFSTLVSCSIKEVWERFDQDLFLALNPPFPPVCLLRFDGCQQGDEVHLKLGFWPLQQSWVSLITSQQTSTEKIVFVDEGQQLPFFLCSWRHEHRLEQQKGHTTIIDAIEYHAPIKLLEWILWPILWWQFRYRQPVYRSYFNKE
jgi:ligand-binding SRPBCC domain-containing protein